jgi:hypothetical protein
MKSNFQFARCGISLVFALLAATACTRPEETAKVSFVLPSAQSLKASSKMSKVSALEVPSIHVAINVTGDGMQGILCGFDSKRGTRSGPCDFGAMPNVTIEIPSGASRLFQVILAVDGDSSVSFFYGETKSDVSSGGPSIPIAVAALSGDGTMGHVFGRFTGSGGNPTGVLRVRYKPPTGTAPITLIEQEMFSGWFQTFAIGGIPMMYELDGVPLFPNAMTWNDFKNLAVPSPPPAANIDDDISLYSESSSFGFVAGWFGPGTNSSTQFVTTSSCSANEFTTCLQLSSTSQSHFNGPFRSSGTGLVNVSGSTLSFSYLPGASSVVDGVKVIKVPSVTNPDSLRDYYIDDGQWDCARLATDFPVDQVTIASPATSGSLGTAPTASDVYFVCPFKGERVFRSAAVFPNIYDHYGHGGYNGPYLYANLGNGGGGDVAELSLGQCYAINLGSYEGHGSALMASSTVTANFSSAGGQFYTNQSDCEAAGTTASTPNLTINPGYNTSTGILYFKPTALGEQALSVTTTSSSYVAYERKLMVTKALMKIIGPMNLAINDCARYEVRRMTSRLEGLPRGLNEPITLSFGTDLAGFTDPTCSSPLTGTSIPASYDNLQFFVKRVSGTTMAPIGFTGLSANYEAQPLSVGYRSGSDLVNKIKFTIIDANPLLPGRCYTARISAVNSVGEEVLAPEGLPVRLDPAFGRLFTSGNCGGESETNFFIPPQSSFLLVRFLALSSVASGAVIDNEGGNFPIEVGAPINVGADSVGSLYLSLAAPGSTNGLPLYRNLILGSHQFGTSKTIAIATNAASSIRCERYDSHGSYIDDCSDKINQTAKILTWDVSDAIAENRLHLSVSDGGKYADFNFDPTKFYGDEFAVFQCGVGAVLPVSGTNVSASTINSFNGSGATVCLKAGTTITMDANIDLSNSKKIIGWAQATDSEAVRVFAPAPQGVTVSGDIGSGLVLANMVLASNGGVPVFSIGGSAIAATSNTPVLLRNLVLRGTGGGQVVLGVQNLDPDIHIYGRGLEIEANVGVSESASVGLKVAESMGPVKLEGVKFRNLGTGANIPTFVEVINSATGGMPPVELDRVTMNGPAKAVRVQGSSYPAGLFLSHAFVDFPTAQDIGTSGFFSVAGNSKLWMRDSIVKVSASNLSSSLFETVTTSGNPQLSLTRNSLQVLADYSFLTINGSNTPTLMWAGNHIMRRAGSGSSAPFISAAVLAFTLNIDPIEYDPISPPGPNLGGTGLNRFCSDAPGVYNWSAPAMNGRNLSGVLTGAPTLATNPLTSSNLCPP